MKIKCRYCGSMIDDTCATCPNCAAPNEDMIREPDINPKTIEELKAFCQKQNMPLEKMRFFIGIDFKEPKAFGIYKDNDGNCVVYKNKADGSRSIRYSGPDEAYAVAQILAKMREEIAIRKANPQNTKRVYTPSTSYVPTSSPTNSRYNSPYRQNVGSTNKYKHKRRRHSHLLQVVFIYIILIVLFQAISIGFISLVNRNGFNSHRGYYIYNNVYYWNDDSSWYYYDVDNNEWVYDSSIDFTEDDATFISYQTFYDEYGDNGYGKYDYDYYYGNHSSSSYDYDYNYDSSSSWDWDWSSSDDWDYDYDSWDYDYSDWDSDW